MRLTQPVRSRDHILGRPDAQVTLVEYLDYECPFCRKAHNALAEVIDRTSDLVRYVPRHFPLSQLHPHALMAAEATEAAAAQGRFWAMHDALFQHQGRLELEAIIGYAAELGLATSILADDLRNHVHLAKVQDDFRSGLRSGVSGTPTFFIDGFRLDRQWDVEVLTSEIRAAAQAHHSAMR